MRWVVGFMPQVLYPGERDRGTHHCTVGCMDLRTNLDIMEERKKSSLLGTEPWLTGHQASNLVIILTELSQFLCGDDNGDANKSI